MTTKTDDDNDVLDTGAEATGADSGEVNYLDMSDEDMMKMTSPPAKGAAAVKPKEEAVVDAGATGDKAAAGDAGAAGDGEGADDADGAKPAKEKVADAGADPKDGEVKDPKEAKKDPVEDKPKADATTIDYKAEYERLTAPFKANGREVKVESVDDAIALMQMGANYNKKMAALKPNIKLMKMLENAGLMSEDKIGYLIDLGKKNPAAISRLVKDSGLDPLDLDAEKAGAYKPTSYAVDDREIELDTVLDDLKESSTYTRTLDVVSNKWDAASKQTIAATPQLLKVIDDHMASGIYDLISTEVERDRMLGRLSGMSDLEAYRKVGDAINARGGFNHLVQAKVASKPQEPVIVQPKTPPVDDDKLKDKRRAASSTKSVTPDPKLPADFNPLALSDEEFMKLATPKFR